MTPTILYSSARKAFVRTSRHIHIAKNIQAMREFKKGNPDLAFVPTMGALHSGHLELVKQAKKISSKVAVSIFVNPTQFSAGEDLDKYPRQFKEDVDKLISLETDAVFVPSQVEMYPGNSLCHVEPPDFNQIYEGQARPEFFRGVATIVCKLFNIVQPKHALFGQKDISQCILIKKMVRDLNIPVNVVICPTMREFDGLAMSSRNVYLSNEERAVASVLFNALSTAKNLCEKEVADGKTVERDEALAVAQGVLSREKMVSKVEYISIASHIDMKELSKITAESGAVISAAIRIGNVRLIDNVLVGRSNADIFDNKYELHKFDL